MFVAEDADKAINDLLFASMPFKANVAPTVRVPLKVEAPDAFKVLKLAFVALKLVKVAEAPVRAPDRDMVVKFADAPVRAPARETPLELPV